MGLVYSIVFLTMELGALGCSVFLNAIAIRYAFFGKGEYGWLLERVAAFWLLFIISFVIFRVLL